MEEFVNNGPTSTDEKKLMAFQTDEPMKMNTRLVSAQIGHKNKLMEFCILLAGT